MIQIKRVTFITVLVVVIAICSLFMSFSALNTSNSLSGVAVVNKENWDISIDNVSTVAVDSSAVMILKEPVVDNTKISYSLRMNQEHGYGQFSFDLKNLGNVNAKIKDIKITGMEGYEEYIDVTISDIKVGDSIKAETIISNIKVVTTYKRQLFDEMIIPQAIILDSINIEIELEKE